MFRSMIWFEDKRAYINKKIVPPVNGSSYPAWNPADSSIGTCLPPPEVNKFVMFKKTASFANTSRLNQISSHDFLIPQNLKVSIAFLFPTFEFTCERISKVLLSGLLRLAANHRTNLNFYKFEKFYYLKNHPTFAKYPIGKLCCSTNFCAI